ncbi:transmembrane protease serine 11D-like [Argiope bruennichi]|uniref:transmembrane protease serine 11D-like n=1 Tax=Argiope bruennichi TaxID=94029 RepID=UPI002494CE91|nr:transmembrane protease serine 11D-like [Argiope bruennichi]
MKLWFSCMMLWGCCANLAFMKQNVTENSNRITENLDLGIINGREAKEGEFPWMVALYLNDTYHCSSFLISPTIVMTAAHCVQSNNVVEPATAFYGIIGNINREGPETRIQFREVAAHPQYKNTASGYDIAVLRVSSPVEMIDLIQFICLPESGKNFDLLYVQAMGWGRTSYNNKDAPKILMTTKLSVLPIPICQSIDAFGGITVTDRNICVYSSRPTGVCYGDSGSPAVYDDPMSGKPVAVGVASFGVECGRPLVPSVYTRIASFIDWLKETVDETNDICFV